MKSVFHQHLLDRYIQAYKLADHLNADLLGCLDVYQFEANQQIFSALTEQTHLYFLVEGKAQISYYLANGKRSIIMMITPLSTIGDMELLGDDPVGMDVVTTEKSTVLGMTKTDALRYGYDDARFLRFLLCYMSDKLRTSGVYQLTADLPLLNRVANYVLSLPLVDNTIAVEEKVIIADLLGTTVRHLNRTIKALEDEGVIKWQKEEVIVHNLCQLQIYGEL